MGEYARIGQNGQVSYIRPQTAENADQTIPKQTWKNEVMVKIFRPVNKLLPDESVQLNQRRFNKVALDIFTSAVPPCGGRRRRSLPCT